jgi:hypothetical protein
MKYTKDSHRRFWAALTKPQIKTLQYLVVPSIKGDEFKWVAFYSDNAVKTDELHAYASTPEEALKKLEEK